MRFRTRYEGWMVAMLIAVGLVLIAIPVLIHFSTPAHGRPPLAIFLIGPVVYALVMTATLPQYYEVREEGLFLRQGWKKTLLSYDALWELSEWNSVLSAPVFSTHRLLVNAAPGGQFVIAVAEQERFLAEVSRHAPQLEVWPSGLKAKGGQPTWL